MVDIRTLLLSLVSPLLRIKSCVFYNRQEVLAVKPRARALEIEALRRVVKLEVLGILDCETKAFGTICIALVSDQSLTSALHKLGSPDQGASVVLSVV